jgi:hypothetical protein
MGAKRQEFDIVLNHFGSGSYGFFVPFDASSIFGTNGRVRVRGTINGRAYRGSLVPQEGGHYLGVNQTMRYAIGKSGGDLVHVTMEVDTEPRIVEVPEDLIWALDANDKAKAIFDKFGYSHRREYVNWIESARKAETRARRVQEAVQRIVSERQGA